MVNNTTYTHVLFFFFQFICLFPRGPTLLPCPCLCQNLGESFTFCSFLSHRFSATIPSSCCCCCCCCYCCQTIGSIFSFPVHTCKSSRPGCSDDDPNSSIPASWPRYSRTSVLFVVSIHGIAMLMIEYPSPINCF